MPCQPNTRQTYTKKAKHSMNNWYTSMKNSSIYMRSIMSRMWRTLIVVDIWKNDCTSGEIAICKAEVTEAINYSVLNFSFAVNELWCQIQAVGKLPGALIKPTIDQSTARNLRVFVKLLLTLPFVKSRQTRKPQNRLKRSLICMRVDVCGHPCQLC